MPKLQQLADWVGGTVQGDGDHLVVAVADFSSATQEDIGFINQRQYLEEAKASNVGAIITTADIANALVNEGKQNASYLISDNPHWAFAVIAKRLHPRQTPEGIHSSAFISASAHVHPSARIGAYCVIEEGACIGEDCVLESHVILKHNAVVGRGCTLLSGAVIAHDCVLGDDVTIREHSVIGSDGFGYAKHSDGWESVPQLGRVVLGDRVEVGANTCIDRGALGDTMIGDGVILDNLIQIAHNVQIGENTAIAATSAIAGSAIIGANCTIAGGVRIVGHIEIVDGTHIAMNTSVSHSIKETGAYAGGTPMDTLRQWRKNAVRFRQLDELFKRLSRLEKKTL